MNVHQVLPVTDGVELEGACESLLLLLDRRQPFYRHTGGPGSGGVAGVEGADLLSVLSEEDWRRGVGFADWVSFGGKRLLMSFVVVVVAAVVVLLLLTLESRVVVVGLKAN